VWAGSLAFDGLAWGYGEYEAVATRRSRADMNALRITNRAFTLVELLVVVAIIALLLAVLLPSLGRAREVARSVICLGNMRMVGVGLMGYSADHQGLMLTGYKRHGISNVWATKIAYPYLQSSRTPGNNPEVGGGKLSNPVVYCPSYPDPDTNGSGTWGGSLSYGMREGPEDRFMGYDGDIVVSLSRPRPNGMRGKEDWQWIRTVSLPAPAVYLLVGDSVRGAWGGPGNDPVGYPRSEMGVRMASIPIYSRPHMRHFSEQLNFWYVDGHAATESFSDLQTSWPVAYAGARTFADMWAFSQDRLSQVRVVGKP
jgi:prepilin-type N-terminal cleavage/methylation domain-containing protein/prepilin-type processing-associated H-X9-DG protein